MRTLINPLSQLLAVCALEHAIYDMHHHPENDDRYKKETR